MGGVVLKYDFHVHSCLSPCGSNDMTPSNIVNLASICNVDALALTDHNTCLNCEAAMKIAAPLGITLIPGMELTTSEEIHVVCLFKELRAAKEFSDFIYEKLPHIVNNPKIFGEQLVIDEEDHVVRSIDKLLINATSISIYSVNNLVRSYDGACFPAHIEKASNSVIANLGCYPDDLGFNTIELFEPQSPEFFYKYLATKALQKIYNSDSHCLEALALSENSLHISSDINKIIDYLK